MRWRIQVESQPSIFTDTGETWDDGFADDGSQWGDDESAAVQAYLSNLQANDPEGRCYCASQVS